MSYEKVMISMQPPETCLGLRPVVNHRLGLPEVSLFSGLGLLLISWGNVRSRSGADGQLLFWTGLLLSVRMPPICTARLVRDNGTTLLIVHLLIIYSLDLLASAFILILLHAVAFTHTVLALPEGRLTLFDKRLNVVTQFFPAVVIH